MNERRSIEEELGGLVKHISNQIQPDSEQFPEQTLLALKLIRGQLEAFNLKSIYLTVSADMRLKQAHQGWVHRRRPTLASSDTWVRGSNVS